MEVMKRSEYCGTPSRALTSLSDIERETVFRAKFGVTNAPHVWIKTNGGDALCLAEPGYGILVGDYAASINHDEMLDYEELNAILVIED